MNRWGSEGPPPEAYSRVSDPERFRPLHDVALRWLEGLEAAFDIEWFEDYGLDRELEVGDLARSSVKLVPRDPTAAPLVIAFTTFPGLKVRVGRWLTANFPACGCDACDETAQAEAARLTAHCSALPVPAIHQSYPQDEQRSAPAVASVAMSPSRRPGPFPGSHASLGLCERRRFVSSKPLTIEQILTLLAGAPPRIVELTDGLAPAQLHTASNQGEWSANDVLAHLRSCADVWGDCIRAIIAQDRPVLRAVNPRTWIKGTDYPQLEFGPSLRAFAAQRAGLLAVLEPLPPEAWSRAATVTGAGKVLERTVHFYAQWMAEHERPHIKQIGRIANTMLK